MKKVLENFIKGFKEKKNIKFIAIGFVLTVAVFVAYIFHGSAVQIISTNTPISSANAWEPYFYPNSTVETFGTSSTNIIEKNTTKSLFGGEFYRLDLTQGNGATKGTSGVILGNVGEYQGHIVDMKITFMDWSYNTSCTLNANHDNEAGIEVYPDPHAKSSSVTEEDALKLKGHIHFSREGCVREMKYKMEFLVHGTNNKLQIGGHFGIYDVDVYNGPDSTHPTTALRFEYIYPNSGISAIYAANPTLCGTRQDTIEPNGILCNEMNVSKSTVVTDGPKYRLTMLYNTDTINLVYGYYNTASTPTAGAGFAGGQPANAIDYPAPIKSVSRYMGSANTSLDVASDEEFFFHVKQFIPHQGDANEMNRLTSLSFEDQIDEDLDLYNCHIVTSANSDDRLDADFDIDCNQMTNKVTATWKGTNLEKMLGKTVMLEVKVRPSREQGKLINSQNFDPSTGKVTITNKGTVTLNSIDTDTNDAVVNVQIPSYTLTVHHYKEGTIEKLALDEVSTKYKDESYSTSVLNPIPDNYEYVSTSGTPSGIISGDTTVTYYYKLKDYTLTVHHYKEGTTEQLALDEVSTKQHGSSYTTSSLNPMPEGYELVGTPANATGTISEDTTVIYYYKLKDYTLTVHHYKEGTTEQLALDEVSTKQHGASYTTSPSSNVSSNYELVTTPDNATGTITGNTTVTYYYKLKKGTVVTKHLEYGTNTPLADEVNEIKNYGEEYETSASSSIPENYILKETPSNYRGTVNSPTTEVIYYYEKKDPQIVPTIEKTGTEAITKSTDKINYTIKYKATFADYTGAATVTIIDHLPYKIDEANSNLNGGTYNEEGKTITWTENIDVNSVTKPTEEITKNIEVKYIEIDKKQEHIVNEVTGNIRAEDKNIDVTSHFNTSINITGRIIVKYVDKDGKELAESIESTGKVGEEFTATAKDIEGYKVVTRPELEKVSYDEEEQTLIYVYEKAKENTVIVPKTAFNVPSYVVIGSIILLLLSAGGIFYVYKGKDLLKLIK